MKRLTILIFIALNLLLSRNLLSVNKKQMEIWVGIITEKDTATKYQKLEDFKTQYGNEKNSTLAPMLYQHLSESAYKLQKFDKAIEYGEKALTFPEVEEPQKLLILFRLANAYFQTKELNKSLEFAQKVVEKGNALKIPNNTQQMDIEFIAPALRLQAKVINNLRPKDSLAMLDAAQKAMEAMKADKSPESDKLVRTLANMLKNSGKEADFWRIIEEIYSIKPDADLAKNLGLYNTQQVKDDQKAMSYFLAAYGLKKSADVAYYLGILYNKGNDVDNALNYLSEAYVQAEKNLRDLYFGSKMKDSPLPQEEKEKAYMQLLEAAKVHPLSNGSAGNAADIDAQINRQADFFVQIEKVVQNIYLFKKLKDSTLSAEEKDKGFHAMLEAAKIRLGMTTAGLEP